jgi:hypothetical protein
VIWHSDEPPPQTTYLNKRLKPAEAKRFHNRAWNLP